MAIPTLALILTLCLTQIGAQTLIYVDDQDPRIQYIPRSSWQIVQGLDGDFGGDHMLVNSDPNAYATIDMAFISFSFVSSKWPYPVTTDVSIDGGPPTTIDLEDYDSVDDGSGRSTVNADVVWTFNGTANEAHTVRISVPPDGPGYAVVDVLIFEGDYPSGIMSSITQTTTTTIQSTITTVQVTTATLAITLTTLTTTPSSTSNSSRPIPNSSPNPGSDTNGSTSHKSHKTAIIAGVLGIFAGLLFLFLIWCFCVRRRRRPQRRRPISIDIGSSVNDDHDRNPGEGIDDTPAPVPPMSEAGAGAGTGALSDANLQTHNLQTFVPSESYGPSSYEYQNRQGGDGLASAAESVVGGRYERARTQSNVPSAYRNRQAGDGLASAQQSTAGGRDEHVYDGKSAGYSR